MTWFLIGLVLGVAGDRAFIYFRNKAKVTAGTLAERHRNPEKSGPRTTGRS